MGRNGEVKGMVGESGGRVEEVERGEGRRRDPTPGSGVEEATEEGSRGEGGEGKKGEGGGEEDSSRARRSEVGRARFGRAGRDGGGRREGEERGEKGWVG